MQTRLFFWLGLLLGGLSTFGTRRQWLPAADPAAPDPLLDLVGEAVVVCDASGSITSLNAAARSLFGTDGANLAQLCYPSGQRVPPGQLPLSRVLRTGKTMEGAGYLLASSEGTLRVLDIAARPLAGGGAAAAIRETTLLQEALQENRTRETTTEKRDQVLRQLCRRLGDAPDAGELARALVESALALVAGLPEGRVRLYLYDSGSKRLARLASAPEGRPKRPKSHRDTQPTTFPFDAASPLLWSVYVAREPVVSGNVEQDERFQAGLGEETTGSACALPLLVGGVAVGHLSVTCRAANAFEDTARRDALAVLASVAALALAGPRQAAQAAHLGAQVEALRDTVQAIGKGLDVGALANLISSHIRRVVGGEVCVLSLESGGVLRLAGTGYLDSLLYPERHAPDDPALHDPAARVGKTMQRVGLANPRLEDGPWRAFAGQSGRHSVLSVPLAAGQGALTVYVAGETPFAEAQVTFVETLAALVSVGLPAASRTATPPDE